NTFLHADGAGSKLLLPNLTAITGDPGGAQGVLILEAFTGATIDASALPQITSSNRVTLYADGASALVNVSSLASFAGHQTYASTIDVRNGGEVRVNNSLTSLDFLTINFAGASTLKTTQITSLTRGN